MSQAKLQILQNNPILGHGKRYRIFSNNRNEFGFKQKFFFQAKTGSAITFKYNFK